MKQVTLFSLLIIIFSDFFCVYSQKNVEVIFSLSGGIYETDSLEIILETNTNNAKIYYTLDSTEPTQESSYYQYPIVIKNRTYIENKFADIETGYSQQKSGNVFKATVLRAVVFENNKQSSNIFTNTYWIAPDIKQYYTLPLISIVADSVDFFSDESGILVTGNLFDIDKPNYSGNCFQKGKLWERKIYIEFYETNGERLFAQYAATRINGYISRSYPQKSLRIYAKKKYDAARFEATLFSSKDSITSYKRLLLRTQDILEEPTMFKDALSASIISEEMNCDIQAYRPVIVFINGEYWGIYDLRERIDKYYIADNYGYSEDNLDMLEISYQENEDGELEQVIEIDEGDDINYNEMIEFIENNDPAETDNYKYIQQLIDIESFIDYYTAQFYFANEDWPFNNIRCWRPRTEDGKWRWIFYDCDFCWKNYKYEVLQEYSSENNDEYQTETMWTDNPEWSKFLFYKLLKNEEFRIKFYNKFLYHLNNTFEPSRVINFIDDFLEMYYLFVPEHINRWHSPKAYNIWTKNVDDLKTFALQRAVILRYALQQNFGLPFIIFPQPTTDELSIKWITEAPNVIKLEIINMNGKNVINKTLKEMSNECEYKINVSHLQTGVYVIKIKYDNFVFCTKIVIMK